MIKNLLALILPSLIAFDMHATTLSRPEHACKVTASSGVQCIGYNAYGQIGNNESDSYKHEATDVKGVGGQGLLQEISAVATGADYSCALKTDGHVLCWGLNSESQLGDNTTNYIPIGLNTIKYDITGNKSAPVYVKDSTGRNSLSDIKSISAGYQHTCAVTNSGHVYCWGDNESGSLGDGTEVARKIPVAVRGSGGIGLLSSVVSIATSSIDSCALITGGSVQCWGPFMGEIIHGKPIPVPIFEADGQHLLTNVRMLVAAGGHFCAAINTGEVKCWGGIFPSPRDTEGADRRLDIVSAGHMSGGAAVIDANYSKTCVLTTTGNYQCWNYDYPAGIQDSKGYINPISPVPTNVVADVITFADTIDSDLDGTVDQFDEFPLDEAYSIDNDHDGKPDEWNKNCGIGCQVNSKLVLDGDVDADGLPNRLDPEPLVPYDASAPGLQVRCGNEFD